MKVLDKKGNEVELYRYAHNSLYKFDRDSDAYIHVWTSAADSTKKKAIKSFEEHEMFA